MRLALVYGLISFTVVTAMGLGIYYLTARYLQNQTENDLAALADFYAAYAAATVVDETRLGVLAPQIASFFATQANYDVRLFSARSGVLLAATRDIGPLPSQAALAEIGHRQPTLFLAGSRDQPHRRYLARPVTAADGTTLGVVEVSRDTAEVERLLAALRLILIGAGGLVLVAALVASALLARQVTRPLSQMESVTQAIASGDFSRRLAVRSDDEIGRLAVSINQMAADLARLEAARREFTAKISHDLRTPLTAIKGFVVNLQDSAPDDMQGTLATMDEQTDRLIRLVNDLLTLSRLQRGALHLRCSEIDLAAVARSAAAIAREKARRLGVTLTAELLDGLPAVHADPDRLQQVTVNLLDNALQATPPGGQVQVSVFTVESEVALTVTDNGQGLTIEEATHAFEPFVHGTGGGAGLGLTIAREIVIAHGGRIWLTPRHEGGAEAGFALPWTPSQAKPEQGSSHR